MSRDIPEMYGGGHLIDHVQSQVKKDHVDQDVRAAMKQVQANERREQIVDELGAEGIGRANEWSDHILQHGPKAALHAAQLYSTQPRPAQPKEEQRDSEPDHMSAARSAYRATLEKERHQGDRYRARSDLDRFEQRFGSLDLLNDFKRWNDQLQANPADAGPRIAQEIHQGVNDAIEQQRAVQTLVEYEKKHPFSAEEREIARRLLSQGLVTNLPQAHAMAKYELSHDVADQVRGVSRDVSRAVRALEAPQRAQAQVEVANWKAAHPDVPAAVYDRMRRLLLSEKAQTLDEAHSMAKAGGRR